MTLLVVKLDDIKYPGNGGTVVAHVACVRDYHNMIEDRDGARDRSFRLWQGEAPIGSKVRLAR